MTRRISIESNEAQLAQAQRVLGTSGDDGAVEASGQNLLRQQRLADLAARLSAGRLLDADPALLPGARRS